MSGLQRRASHELVGGTGFRTIAGSMADMVRIDALTSFADVVHECGGNPAALLARFDIDPDIFDQPDAVLPYRTMVALLEDSSLRLNRPDFGMRLAHRQKANGTMGPGTIAMRNCPTLGEAFRYVSEHIYLYCSGVETGLHLDDLGRWQVRFEMLLDRIPRRAQAIEHALLNIYQAMSALSGGRARPLEVWFTHEPMAAMIHYAQYFEAPLKFGSHCNAIILDGAARHLPVVDRSDRLFRIANRYIEIEYPAPERLLGTRVRSLVGDLLPSSSNLHKEVAKELAMHPRTLQRRLREEGVSFETIKDDMRRETAWRYLTETRMSLTRIAASLGYSEPSAFTRGCYRWFQRAPTEIRSTYR